MKWTDNHGMTEKGAWLLTILITFGLLIVISAFVTILSLGLLTVSFVSYRKYRKTKLFFVSCVFLVFLIKGMLLSIGLFFDDVAIFSTGIYGGFFDMIILILLFIATLKR